MRGSISYQQPSTVSGEAQHFAAALVEAMGFQAEATADIAARLEVTKDGPDVQLRFEWCDRSQLVSTDGPLAAAVYNFALDVADDLKEHLGRGDPVPWEIETA